MHLEAEYGPTDSLPKGPEGRVERPRVRTEDVMYDEEFGDGVEFEAVALSLYGRSTV